MKFLISLLLLSGCAHKGMNIKSAMKMCRKINGPLQEMPKPLPKNLAAAQQSVMSIVNSCYKEHVERTRDPRDYVSCTLVDFVPSHKPTLTIKSSEEFLVPNIVTECAKLKVSKFKNWPAVKKKLRMEFVFHHIAVTKG